MKKSVSRNSKVPICVFVKPPRPGEVKTRLIPAVGAVGAARFAQSFFDDTWESLSTLSWGYPVVACTEPFHFKDARTVWVQRGSDLGDRMESVLRFALEGSVAAFALGTDSPGLPMKVLNSSYQALNQSDAVLGPSDDGGFYLLGLKRCSPGLLSDIRWSQSDTFVQTLARLKQASMSVAVIEPWFDVDTPQDLVRLRTLIRAGAIYAPSTEATFKSTGLYSCMNIN